jgi:geranylgeranyl reductase
MDSFDIVIVGAGPAGLNCAETLGGSRYKVLLLEKNKEIGPKVCAGGITDKTVDHLNLPKRLIDSSFFEAKLHFGKTCTIASFDSPFVSTIDRKHFGQWQLQKLKKHKNIFVWKGMRVSEIRDNYIVANGKIIRYKFLVGADGSLSIVKRYLGIKQKASIAIQYVIKTNKYRDLEFFFDSKLFSSWYAWIFPHKGYASVGCLCDPDVMPAEFLQENFAAWLETNSIDISKAKHEAFFIDYDYQGFRFGNVLLAGDAAGLASRLSGEGIYPALVSGEEVAKVIMNPFYEPEKLKSLVKKKEKLDMLSGFLIGLGPLRGAFFSTGPLMTTISPLRKKVKQLLF